MPWQKFLSGSGFRDRGLGGALRYSGFQVLSSRFVELQVLGLLRLDSPTRSRASFNIQGSKLKRGRARV